MPSPEACPAAGLLLGGAIICPLQLDEPAWHSVGESAPRWSASSGAGLGLARLGRARANR